MTDLQHLGGDPRWGRAARIIAAALGALLLVLGVFGQALGIADAGLGRTQFLASLLGAVLILTAWLGSRTLRAYRAGAIIALNTVVLLTCAELAAGIALRLREAASNDAAPDRTRLRYYAERDWARTYWEEDDEVGAATRYEPYIIWRTGPTTGRTINVDARTGNRATPGSQCEPGAYTVFAFGGSGLWGVGSPDWGTIPAHLRTALANETGRPVCMENFGERGHVSTQGLIQLMRQLQRGSVPDLVIFYDSVNDLFTAEVYRRPGLHMWTELVAEKLEDGARYDWLTSSNLFRLVQRVTAASADVSASERSSAPDFRGVRRPPVPAERLPQAVVDVYLHNYRMVEALAGSYGFRFEFFWQPHIVAGSKPLTDEERRIRESDSRPFHDQLHVETFRRIERAATEVAHLTYLGDVFDDRRDFTYIDSHHVTPEANALIVDRIMEVLRSRAADHPASGALRSGPS